MGLLYTKHCKMDAVGINPPFLTPAIDNNNTNSNSDDWHSRPKWNFGGIVYQPVPVLKAVVFNRRDDVQGENLLWFATDVSDFSAACFV
jgi:hypothetical protein